MGPPRRRRRSVRRSRGVMRRKSWKSWWKRFARVRTPSWRSTLMRSEQNTHRMSCSKLSSLRRMGPRRNAWRPPGGRCGKHEAQQRGSWRWDCCAIAVRNHSRRVRVSCAGCRPNTALQTAPLWPASFCAYAGGDARAVGVVSRRARAVCGVRFAVEPVPFLNERARRGRGVCNRRCRPRPEGP